MEKTKMSSWSRSTVGIWGASATHIKHYANVDPVTCDTLASARVVLEVFSVW